MNKLLRGLCAAAVSVGLAAGGLIVRAEEVSADKTLDADVTETITIPEGATVKLDLNGHNINVASGDAIVNKGTLTITGAGNVSTNAAGSAAIANLPNGNVTVEGGNYSSSNWYVIKNLGTVIINGGTVAGTDRNTASLIDNGWVNSTDKVAGNDYSAGTSTPNLTINDGNFVGKSGANSCSVVKNDDYGILAINGGTFDSTANSGSSDAATIINWNTAIISGGTFKGSYISNGGISGSDADAGNLIITGGIFEEGFGINKGASSGTGKVTITGGTFNKSVGLNTTIYTNEIYGGTFKEDPTLSGGVIAANLVKIDNGDGTYTVGPAAPASTPASSSTPASASTSSTPAPAAAAWINPTLQPAGYQGYTPDGQLVTSLGDGTVVDQNNNVWDGFGNRIGYFDTNTGTVVKPVSTAAASANGRYIVPNTGVK